MSGRGQYEFVALSRLGAREEADRQRQAELQPAAAIELFIAATD